MYQKTSNISVSSFKSSVNETVQARNHFDCAAKCFRQLRLGKKNKTFVYNISINCCFKKIGKGSCNSYSFDKIKSTCELANLLFLEDPLSDGSDGGEKTVIIRK